MFFHIYDMCVVVSFLVLVVCSRFSSFALFQRLDQLCTKLFSNVMSGDRSIDDDQHDDDHDDDDDQHCDDYDDDDDQQEQISIDR